MPTVQITFPDLVQLIITDLREQTGREKEGFVHVFSPKGYTTIDTRTDQPQSFDLKTRELTTITCKGLFEFPYGKSPIDTIESLLADEATIGFYPLDTGIAAYIEKTGILHMQARPIIYQREGRTYTIFTPGTQTSERGIILSGNMSEITTQII